MTKSQGGYQTLSGKKISLDWTAGGKGKGGGHTYSLDRFGRIRA